MIKYVLIVHALLLCGCEGSSDPPEQDSPNPRPTVTPVVFVGDSIMAGWRDLAELVPGSINAGVGGSSTEQMLDRFDRDVLFHHPALVVIEGGINDIVSLQGPTPRHVAAMADRAAAQGAHVVLLAITPTKLDTWVSELTQLWNEELRLTAQTYGYTYVDFSRAMRLPNGLVNTDYLCSDGVHLTPEGYEAIWPILQAALARRSRGDARLRGESTTGHSGCCCDVL